MPSYFYHLKFELYSYIEPPDPPSEEPSTRTRTKEEEEDRRRDIWLPTPDTDIFDTTAWPAHPVVVPAPAQSEGQGRRKRGSLLPGGVEYGRRASLQPTQPTARLRGGGVIDCGPTRASPHSSEDSEPTLQPIGPDTKLEFPTPNPAHIQRTQEVAVKDWRFGRVRVEGLDVMGSTERPGHRRGESSSQIGNGFGEGNRDRHTNGNGINVGLAPAGGAVGKVTKARFEELSGPKVEGKNTEVGWGVVHLYRDGEENLGLATGMGGNGLYGADDSQRGAVTSGGLGEPNLEDKGVVGDYTTLCIPAVPSYLSPSDFLGLVGEKTRRQVSHFRMVMTGRMNRYLVLMKFRDAAAARKWSEEWDGKVFNSMEPETCHVVFIKSITFQTPNTTAAKSPSTSFPELSHDPFTPSAVTSTHLKPFPPPTANLVELPTCPVCLERMDDTTGLLTILCQHVFHCDCLQKWRGSGCPVCRATVPSITSGSPTTYDPANPPFGIGDASLCSVCDCTDDLWICLICGSVGCGRYKGGHAKGHWKDSAHNFALEIETQHVWDYAGDMWVHRLIRDKGDGKVVELPSSNRPQGLGGRAMGGDQHHDMDMVPREKLDNIGMEYTHLLTSQLESQRVYFEELVSKAVAKASAASAAAASASTRADEAISKLKDLEIENKKLREEIVVELDKDLAREKKKVEKSTEVARGFGKSLMEEKKVSEGLMERIGHVNKSMMEMSKEMSTLKEENFELKEQNRDLLFSITAQQKLKDMEGEGGGLEAGELEGGTVSLPPEKRKGKGRGRKG